MNTTHKLLLGILLSALVFRLLLLPMIAHPGISDPNHYYNLGGFLLEGKGLTIDYVWQFNAPPDTLEHPDDYWMPLNNYIVAFSMALFGKNVQGALVVFVVMGALVPLIAFYASKQFGVGDDGALFAAVSVAFLPEFLLRSLQTDTTLPSVLLVGGAVLLLTHGLQRGNIGHFLLAGVLAGMGYLVRSDASLLVPMVIVTVLTYALWGREQLIQRARLWQALLIIGVAVAIVVPWSLRNIALFGTISTPNLEQMFYLTDYRQHFVYSTPVTLQTMLAEQSVAQLIQKRLFEVLASLRVMVFTLEGILPLLMIYGAWVTWRERNRNRWLAIAPSLILMGGIFVFYTVLVPMKSQGGSFKKMYLTMIPLLIPFGALAFEALFSTPTQRRVVTAISACLLMASAWYLVRNDSQFVQSYMAFSQDIVNTVNTLGDSNGDETPVLMTLDPFMMRFYGLQSVMIPYDTREAVLEVAQRYRVDYILLPADRPTLDHLTQGESDPCFEPVATIPNSKNQLFRLVNACIEN